MIVLLAASRQGFKYGTWFISSKMYRNTEDINSKSVGVSQVSQLVVMILLINDCYVMSLVVIISRMNFVLYRNNDIFTCEKNHCCYGHIINRAFHSKIIIIIIIII